MTNDPQLYADDPDVHVITEIVDRSGGPLDFTAKVRVDGFEDITCSWEGDAATPHPDQADWTVRDLRIPLYGLPAGEVLGLRLIVDGDNDTSLGNVVLT